MSEVGRKIDPVKLTDFEISLLLIERDAAQYKVERIDELLNLIGHAKGLEDVKKETPATENRTGQALPGSEDLNKLPWRSYQTKEAAKENEAAWIFANTKGAGALLATLKTKGEKVQLGKFEYQLQGNEKQFIARKPLK